MQTPENLEREVVDYKIRRALSIKALREIRLLVDGFEQDQRTSQRARLIAVLGLIAFLLVAVSVILWPPIFRLATGLVA